MSCIASLEEVSWSPYSIMHVVFNATILWTEVYPVFQYNTAYETTSVHMHADDKHTLILEVIQYVCNVSVKRIYRCYTTSLKLNFIQTTASIQTAQHMLASTIIFMTIVGYYIQPHTIECVSVAVAPILQSTNSQSANWSHPPNTHIHKAAIDSRHGNKSDDELKDNAINKY